MNDITAQPYAEWLEASLRELVELNPRTIGIVVILPDGSTGTQYFNADNRDRLVMCEAINIDYLEELLRVNADGLRQILDGEEDQGDPQGNLL
jgi:hypothetical protein